ncbi:hypothetical protein G6F23_016075 [Rhizopus arrhizus]|nr:hypothetical protein G6F23_016075 [Rhizopus arrhizus]
MDRHDEPDRAAGRFRPGDDPHARTAGGRRPLPAVGHQDLHHLRRPRPDREHPAPGVGAAAGRARRRQRHFALPGA